MEYEMANFQSNNSDESDTDVKLFLSGEDDYQTRVVRQFLVNLIVAVIGLVVVIFLAGCSFSRLWQKTRSSPQRRQFAGTRNRPSLSQNEPTIFVSPSNYPPPPKYEVMDPPSYEEVVGIHYPNYPPSQFPITRPLAVALAQNAAPPVTNNVITNCNVACESNADSLPNNVTQTSPNVASVTNERTSSVAVASS